MSDLLDDIEPAPRRRWTDHNPERRSIVTLKPTASVEFRNNGMPYPRVFMLTCSGCGNVFASPRRQLPGKHAWCPNCRLTGEPAAQRARDYRARNNKDAS